MNTKNINNIIDYVLPEMTLADRRREVLEILAKQIGQNLKNPAECRIVVSKKDTKVYGIINDPDEIDESFAALAWDIVKQPNNILAVYILPERNTVWQIMLDKFNRQSDDWLDLQMVAEIYLSMLEDQKH